MSICFRKFSNLIEFKGLCFLCGCIDKRWYIQILSSLPSQGWASISIKNCFSYEAQMLNHIYFFPRMYLFLWNKIPNELDMEPRALHKLFLQWKWNSVLQLVSTISGAAQDETWLLLKNIQKLIFNVFLITFLFRAVSIHSKIEHNPRLNICSLSSMHRIPDGWHYEHFHIPPLRIRIQIWRHADSTDHMSNHSGGGGGFWCSVLNPVLTKYIQYSFAVVQHLRNHLYFILYLHN